MVKVARTYYKVSLTAHMVEKPNRKYSFEKFLIKLMKELKLRLRYKSSQFSRRPFGASFYLKI